METDMDSGPGRTLILIRSTGCYRCGSNTFFIIISYVEDGGPEAASLAEQVRQAAESTLVLQGMVLESTSGTACCTGNHFRIGVAHF